jgi:predicted nucleotide-binding protein (sugar kinase/HSP70/actin superfamily)
MTQSVTLDTQKKKSLPVIGGDSASTLDVDAELERFADEERARLGLEVERRWVEDMANLHFTKAEKSKITLLIGGLTMAHDRLVEGSFRSLGYNVLALDCPDYDALRVGKEFGNRAQCNPTYFTVGNLVKFLIHLRDEKGLSSKEVVDGYVFLTAGACGPCRFGMYVTEYRKALRDAGFDGFRVMLFQQQGGLSQATGEESGLEMTPKFFIGMLKGLLAGDIINGLGYRIRPYEVTRGDTDKVIEQAKDLCYDALLNDKSVLVALLKAKKLFAKIEVDRTIPKPKTAIIGEFWAMTTEGDGNYQLQRFLESEGSECDIQFVTAWLLYNVWEVRNDTANRALLRGADTAKSGLGSLGEFGIFQRRVGLWAADKALRLAFQTFAHAGGFYGYKLPDMDAIADVASAHYNNDLRGGEGHMEVGKLILNVVKSKATMTLSVKPFGCMPSSGVSDGVQTLITEKFPGTIFCAVETSGDGAVNFQSRVQMYMFKARQAAEAEFERALQETGLALDEFRSFVKRHPRLKKALHIAPHRAGSTPADLVYEAAHFAKTTRSQRVMRGIVSGVKGVTAWAAAQTKTAPETFVSVVKTTGTGAKEIGEIVKERGAEFVQRKMATWRPAKESAPASEATSSDEMPVAAE